jgi:hypothetical protein
LKIERGNSRGDDARTFLAVAGLRGSGSVATLAFTVLVARLLDPLDSGLVLLAVAVTRSMTYLGTLGRDMDLARVLPGQMERGEFTKVCRNAATAARAGCYTGIAAAAAAAALISGWALLRAELHSAWIPILLVSVSLVPATVVSILAESLRGIYKVIPSAVANPAVPGLVTVVTVGPLAALLGSPGAGAAVLIGQLAALAAAVALWQRLQPRDEQPGTTDAATMSHAALGVLSVAMASQGWLDSAILGIAVAPDQIAAFSVATALAATIQFGLSSTNAVFAPRIAGAVARGDRAATGHWYRKSLGTSIIVTAVPLATMLIFAEPILRMAGTAAESSAAALRILVAGQAVNVLVGPVGPVLLAQRDDRYLASAVIGAMVLQAILTLTLCRWLGMGNAGVALAGAASLATLNAACLVRVLVLARAER